MSLGHLETRVSGLGPEWQPLTNGSELSLAVLDQVNIEVHRGIEHCQQVRYLTDFVRPGRPSCDLEDHVNGWYESIWTNLSMFCLSKLPNIWYPPHSVTNNKHWICEYSCWKIIHKNYFTSPSAMMRLAWVWRTSEGELVDDDLVELLLRVNDLILKICIKIIDFLLTLMNL